MPASYVEPAKEKDLHFFDSRKWLKKGTDWYRSQFPAPVARDGRRVIAGEASSYYLFHPLSARSIRRILPNVKLVALLRNPVDRAYSAYLHKVRAGKEDLSFEQALAAEEERTSGELQKILSDESYHSGAYARYTNRSRGIYVDQLERWHEHFSPEQLLVLKSEYLFADPTGSVGLVHGFLGLPERDIDITMRGRRKASKQLMNPATRQQLQGFFEPHNRRLYEYLGVDFGW